MKSNENKPRLTHLDLSVAIPITILYLITLCRERAQHHYLAIDRFMEKHSSLVYNGTESIIIEHGNLVGLVRWLSPS